MLCPPPFLLRNFSPRTKQDLVNWKLFLHRDDRPSRSKREKNNCEPSCILIPRSTWKKRPYEYRTLGPFPETHSIHTAAPVTFSWNSTHFHFLFPFRPYNFRERLQACQSPSIYRFQKRAVALLCARLSASIENNRTYSLVLADDSDPLAQLSRSWVEVFDTSDDLLFLCLPSLDLCASAASDIRLNHL